MKNLLACFFMITLLFSCEGKQEAISFNRSLSSPEDLMKHSEEFNKAEVIQVTDGIHVAIGFGLANSILIEGTNGNIIVDCTESNEVAARVKAEFEKISPKPIRAIIYTHNHTDHIFGAQVMAGDDNPEVYAHELVNYYIDRLTSVVRPVVGRRSYRMFGTKLDDETRLNCGIGPFLDADETTTRALLRPTITFKDELDLDIEGVKIKLAHAPGETNDQLYVWLPDKKVLMPGDNIYRAFPNLYTIRGTPYRDVKQWANSLDQMRYLEPEIIVPSHTRPIQGAANVETVLRNYADAVRFVHDQTIRQMNKGLTPDEIVEAVILPEHLSKSPYLKEFYGRVDWSVRNVFNGYLGWFDGNSSTLLPLYPMEKAEKMAGLAGGNDELLESADMALNNKEYQWALELTDYLLRLLPKDERVKEIRFQSLIGLGEQQSNPNARNYYLSEALEVKGQSMETVINKPLSVVHSIPMGTLFSALAVNLIPEKSIDFHKKALFRFTDTNEVWTVIIRNGVMEFQPRPFEDPDLIIETTAIVWKEIVSKMRKPAMSLASGDLKIEGGLGEFSKFMGMFKEE